jgi:hypothetical protein
VLESIVIEDVWFKAHTSIELAVYNVGKVDSKIDSIYVNDLPASSFQISAIYSRGREVSKPTANLAIPVNGHVNVTIALFIPGWNDHTVYEIKIVTARGSSFEGKYISPN